MLCGGLLRAQSHATVDVGWIRATQTDGGAWLVSRCTQFTPSGEVVRAGDAIVAINHQNIAGSSALQARELLFHIVVDASTVSVLRDGVEKELRLFPADQPLLKTGRLYSTLPLVAVTHAGDDLAPVFSLPDEFGKMHAVQYGPKWTLLHVWSTNCPACWKDVPALNEILHPAPDSLAVIVIAMGDDAAGIRSFSRVHGPVEFTSLLAGQVRDEFWSKFNWPGVPLDVLVDPSGRVRFVGAGSGSLTRALESFKQLPASQQFVESQPSAPGGSAR